MFGPSRQTATGLIEAGPNARLRRNRMF